MSLIAHKYQQYVQKSALGLVILRKIIEQPICNELSDLLLNEDRWENLYFRSHSGSVAHEDAAQENAQVSYDFEFPENLVSKLIEISKMVASEQWGFTQLQSTRVTASRFTKGMSLSPHKDTSYADTNRLITVVIYPNEEYRGGETYWPNLRQRHQPAAGDIALFFSEHRHGVDQVTSGTRYNGVFFLTT